MDQGDFHKTIDEHYMVMTDNYGGDRSLDVSDGNPVWMTIYLDGLQFLYNFDVNKIKNQQKNQQKINNYR